MNNHPHTLPEIIGMGLGIAILALAFFTALRAIWALAVSFGRDVKNWRPSAKSLAVWAGRPARWWQFWRPQSGIVGGLILAAIALAVTLFVYHYLPFGD